MRFSAPIAAATLLAATSAHAQTMQRLTHPAPDSASITFVLTDGTVLAQGERYSDWWRLTPDSKGSYVTGKWTQVASLPKGYLPLYFASAVLADGRLVICGGEYNNLIFTFSNICAVYDPVANTWTEFAPPTGWNFIGDSPSSMLPNGTWLLGSKFDKRDAALNPATLTWTALKNTGKKDFNAEEGWTLLPNGTILTYDVKAAPNSEIYSSTKQKWLTAGSTLANLAGPPDVKIVKYGNGMIYHPPGEVGPAILRPDGTVFASGAANKNVAYGHTAIYTPPAAGNGIGTWAAGPNFPAGDQAADSFAALLPTGNVLVEGSNTGALYEFNGTTLTQTKFTAPGGPLGGSGSLLVLPTGQILIGGYAVYQAAGTVNPAWAPVITSVATTLARGTTYPITGQQFNGLSQANGFGDELETATNYPLVRITNNATGDVIYARTHNHSTMGVATGNAPVSTNVDIPAGAEVGASTLVVVANGIPSAPVSVTIK